MSCVVFLWAHSLLSFAVTCIILLQRRRGTLKWLPISFRGWKLKTYYETASMTSNVMHPKGGGKKKNMNTTLLPSGFQALNKVLSSCVQRWVCTKSTQRRHLRHTLKDLHRRSGMEEKSLSGDVRSCECFLASRIQCEHPLDKKYHQPLAGR